MLSDHYLHTEYAIILGNSNYQFTMDKTLPGSQEPGRFSISMNQQDPVDPLENKISIFPNPFDDQVNIVHSTDLNDRLELTITDMAGRILITNQTFPGHNSSILDTQYLLKGFYVLTVTNTKSKKILITRKLIKI